MIHRAVLAFALFAASSLSFAQSSATVPQAPPPQEARNGIGAQSFQQLGAAASGSQTSTQGTPASPGSTILLQPNFNPFSRRPFFGDMSDAADPKAAASPAPQPAPAGAAQTPASKVPRYGDERMKESTPGKAPAGVQNSMGSVLPAAPAAPTAAAAPVKPRYLLAKPGEFNMISINRQESIWRQRENLFARQSFVPPLVTDNPLINDFSSINPASRDVFLALARQGLEHGKISLEFSRRTPESFNAWAQAILSQGPCLVVRGQENICKR